MPNASAFSQGLLSTPGLLAFAQEKHYSPGEYVFKQGQEDPHFYLVMEGEIEIGLRTVDGQEKIIAHVSAGELLGEGVLSGKTLKPASARATAPLRVLALSHENFIKWSESDPAGAIEFLLSVLKVVNQRLNKGNVKLIALYETSESIRQHRGELSPLCSSLLRQLVALTEAGEGAMLLKNPFSEEWRTACVKGAFLQTKDLTTLDLTQSHCFTENDGHFLVVNLKSFGAIVLFRPLIEKPFDLDQLRLAELVGEQVASTLEDTSRQAEEKARTILHQKRYVL